MARSTKAGSAQPAGLPLVRLLAVSVVALTTANCAQNTQKLAGPAGSSSSSYDPKYGVKASPRLYQEGDAIPKGGGRRFSGKPYVVAGRTYVPRDDAKGYVREGLASWYGSAFHGRMTANGEVFDRHSIAAAHPTLPLPSYVRVTNLANRHSMIVRVNDRGPYHANRVMDVSEEVAQALEFHRSGTAKVRVEYVGKASTAGSDDRKLMATLRTDGAPANVGGRSPVMMADLGPDAEPERFERAQRPALAFKPAVEEEDAAPTPRPARSAPVLVAGGSHVAVPAALQPTTARSNGFQPTVPMRSAPVMQMAHAAPKARESAPLDIAPPSMRLASFAAPANGSSSKRGVASTAEAKMPEAKMLHAKLATSGPKTKVAQMAIPAAPQRMAVAAPSRGTALTMAGRTGPLVKTALATPPARPGTAYVPVAGLRPAPLPSSPLATAKAGIAKLSVPPAGSQLANSQLGNSQLANSQFGRGKSSSPAIATAAAKPAPSRRSRIAEVN
ncbi:septal ring lytic transglycosylase RlpA family protein [Methylobacterium sp. 77]|uniref:septal ring lytic transglycosylase RlpA family protein n=1 Tax=Methylobacterium sp. 77 TaxID=1101192 RepID=UPI000381EA94|nr:septal ring lytic transglycosylase RlpA family protein [Methylobacterium sp. 77]